MHWLNKVRTLFHRPQLEVQMDDELRFHLEKQTEQNIARGLSAHEARYAALRQFGNIGQLKEECRDTWGMRLISELVQDIGYGFRQLHRNPGFATISILTLALGIGATTALFTVVRSVLLTPLPYKHPGQLLRLYERNAEGFPYNYSAGGVFAEWKKQSHGFSSMALVFPGAGYSLAGAGGQLPERLRAVECTSSLFSTLGVAPALGRTFTASEDQPSAPATVVLSWGLWQRRFGGDHFILNQTIDLDGKPYTVIGVMPAWFAYPDDSVQLWTPIYHEEPTREIQAIDSHDYMAIGRLKDGVRPDEATAELSVIVHRLHNQHLDDPFVSIGANSQPLLEDMVGNIKTPLYVLLAATACLLLIACLNVASLQVARSEARRKELAIRAALGGSRWRLLAGHMTESLLLSAGGGIAGLLLAYGITRAFVRIRPDVSTLRSIHSDGVVVAFVLGLVFVCGIFACLASSLSIKNGRILPALQETTRSQSAGHGRVRLRKWLVSLEVALTLILLVGAGLLLKGYQSLRSSDLGCITDYVLTMRFNLPEGKYSQAAERVNFYESLLERVRALPGVRAAGLVRMVPGQGYGGDSGFTIAGHPPLPVGKGQTALVRWADPGYFATLGIPLLRGKMFDESQRLQSASEVIISQLFARQYFPGEDPIGRHLLTMGQRPFEIVGVVGDTRFNVAKPVEPMMYFPVFSRLYEDSVVPSATLAVRSARDVASLALPVQRVFQQLDPELAVSDVLTMDQIIGKSTFDANFNATLLLAFAVLSLTLASVGLFGVVSYVVAQRTREIGIRVALGAHKSHVLRLIVGQGMVPTLLGMAIGLAASIALTRFLASLLYGVKPTDPFTFVAVSLILISVALAACYIPARRAAKVDPMVALRYE
ncbi:MAG TPA: ABC transporter permease [Terriglobia bacterium]|nr:ABC transporter permease [Terriglobia bacterium]